jgi:hypothetical protein
MAVGIVQDQSILVGAIFHKAARPAMAAKPTLIPKKTLDDS